jgi:hypothetical protein
LSGADDSRASIRDVGVRAATPKPRCRDSVRREDAHPDDLSSLQRRAQREPLRKAYGPGSRDPSCSHSATTRNSSETRRCRDDGWKDPLDCCGGRQHRYGAVGRHIKTSSTYCAPSAKRQTPEAEGQAECVSGRKGGRRLCEGRRASSVRRWQMESLPHGSWSLRVESPTPLDAKNRGCETRHRSDFTSRRLDRSTLRRFRARLCFQNLADSETSRHIDFCRQSKSPEKTNQDRPDSRICHHRTWGHGHIPPRHLHI